MKSDKRRFILIDNWSQLDGIIDPWITCWLPDSYIKPSLAQSNSVRIYVCVSRSIILCIKGGQENEPHDNGSVYHVVITILPCLHCKPLSLHRNVIEYLKYLFIVN